MYVCVAQMIAERSVAYKTQTRFLTFASDSDLKALCIVYTRRSHCEKI